MQKISDLLNSRKGFSPKIKLLEISETSGVSIGAVCEIASGKSRNPRYETVIRLISGMRALRKGRKRLPREEGTA